MSRGAVQIIFHKRYLGLAPQPVNDARLAFTYSALWLWYGCTQSQARKANPLVPGPHCNSCLILHAGLRHKSSTTEAYVMCWLASKTPKPFTILNQGSKPQSLKSNVAGIFRTEAIWRVTELHAEVWKAKIHTQGTPT